MRRFILTIAAFLMMMSVMGVKAEASIKKVTVHVKTYGSQISFSNTVRLSVFRNPQAKERNYIHLLIAGMAERARLRLCIRIIKQKPERA